MDNNNKENGSKYKVTFISNDYKNAETGEKAEGLTIIVNGILKEGLDKIIRESNGKYKSYAEVLGDAVFMGLYKVVENIRNGVTDDPTGLR